MKFYLLDTLADCGEGDYCFTDEEPEGIGFSTYQLSDGIPLAANYPKDPLEVSLQLGEDCLGLKLPSLIGNTSGLLIVHKEVAEVILKHQAGEIEVLPFTLYNHKKRVHSKDYVFVNPLGALDCLNYALTVMDRARSGKILEIEKFVLDKEKVNIFPDLFRPKDLPDNYIFSERLVETIKSREFTNFFFNEIEQG